MCVCVLGGLTGREKKKKERGALGRESDMVLTNQKSYNVIVIIINAIVFITLSIITITVLCPHMYPIPRIISSLSVVPGGCVIFCCCCRHSDARLQPTRYFFLFFFYPFFWDSCCARFTVATVGCCFRSHYSDLLMTLK